MRLACAAGARCRRVRLGRVASSEAGHQHQHQRRRRHRHCYLHVALGAKLSECCWLKAASRGVRRHSGTPDSQRHSADKGAGLSPRTVRSRGLREPFLLGRPAGTCWAGSSLPCRVVGSCSGRPCVVFVVNVSFYFFLKGGEEGEREGEKHRHERAASLSRLARPRRGPDPTTLAPALTGSDPSPAG